MADEYTIELEGHTFAAAPVAAWNATRVHRQDVYPNVLVAIEYEIPLERCRIYSDSPAEAVEDLATFLRSTLHKRVVPSYLKIKDEAGVPIDEIGDVNVGTAGWEDVRVESFSIPPAPELLKAGAEFSLLVRARRVFHDDTTGLVEFERIYRSETGPDGLEVRTLTSRMRFSRQSGRTPVSPQVVSLLRLSKPAGFVRTIGNNSNGFDVEYPNHPRTDVAVVTSQVKRVGQGVAIPEGAGDVGGGTTRRDEPDMGLVRVTTFVDATGATDGDGYLESAKPAGGVGEQTHDRARRQVRGAWDRFEPASAFLDGRTTRIAVSRILRPGGRVLRVSRLTGNLLPIVRRGSVREWRMTEVVRAVALGPTTLDEFPTLPPLGAPWELDLEASSEGAPEIVERGGAPDQHVWQRISTREYVWTGDTPPIDDESFRRLLMRRYEAGEEGLVLA